MLNQSPIASNAKREVEKWQNVDEGRNQRLITPAGHATQTHGQAHAYISSTWLSVSVCVCMYVCEWDFRCETWPEVGVKDTTCQGWALQPFSSFSPTKKAQSFLQNGALTYATVYHRVYMCVCVCGCTLTTWSSRFDSNWTFACFNTINTACLSAPGKSEGGAIGENGAEGATYAADTLVKKYYQLFVINFGCIDSSKKFLLASWPTSFRLLMSNKMLASDELISIFNYFSHRSFKNNHIFGSLYFLFTPK